MKINFLLLLFLPWISFSQKFSEELDSAEQTLYIEHLAFGAPVPTAQNHEGIYVRQGYILQYNDTLRIPNWVAYHIIPDYLNTPKRDKKYKRFRTDPDVPNPVKDEEYTNSGYARGHLAPYFAMGGDRDGDGIYADLEDEASDPEDDLTVFQANYMSNIAPQDQDALNGSGGPWYKLETAIRTKIVGLHKRELHLVLGGIFSDPQKPDYIIVNGDTTDIAVPDTFYQVLITQADNGFQTAGFIFPHVREKADLPYKNLIDYLVPVDSVEQMSGYNFFPSLDIESTESQTNREFWEGIMK